MLLGVAKWSWLVGPKRLSKAWIALKTSIACSVELVSLDLDRLFPSSPIVLRRNRSDSGRPTYVFQHAHPTALNTTPW